MNRWDMTPFCGEAPSGAGIAVIAEAYIIIAMLVCGLYNAPVSMSYYMASWHCDGLYIQSEDDFVLVCFYILDSIASKLVY
jgi:hypothetical protein